MKRFLNLKWAVVLLVAAVLIVTASIRIMEATAPVEAALDVDQIRERDGIPVEVIRVQEAPLQIRRRFTGTVRAIRSATVRAGTGDQILEIPFRVGQSVSEGAVVVRQSSRGSVASVEQADAAYQQALRTVDRLRPVYERGGISEQDWDNALTSLSVAESNLEAARKAIVLTSPIRGTVTDVLVNPGTYPGSGDPLVRISDLSRMQVLLAVTPEQRRELALGQPAYLPDSDVRGEVTRIALQADPESRLLEVEVTFPGASSLFPGTLTGVDVVVLERESAMSLPAGAVDGSSVWVVDPDGEARRVSVEVGTRSLGRVEILSGLEPGATVVTAGASLLSDGAQTRIVGG
jgi:membrane fusion protein (multidrug efflux system)